jgi:RHS repeat-associated protein
VTTTSFLADAGGHQIRLIDPDRGTEFTFYDANGNVVQSVDARGSAGTAYAGYDALNRQLWRNTTSSPTGAYVTYTYDGAVPSGVSCSGITPGNNAIGHRTTERFTSGPGNSFSGAYCYGYDARGEPIGEVDTLAGTTYLPILYTYNDAGMPLKLTYPTTEYALNNYSSQGWLTSITRSARGTTNQLVPSITYNGAAGAAGLPDSYVIGGSGSCSSGNSSIICASFSYDGDLRPTQATFTHPTSSTPIMDYSLGVTYDAAGNILSLSSGLPAAGGVSGGQDHQQFCYDEQDRLTWAGNSGTNPCTSQAVTGTTLPTGSAYTASYQYDVLGRLAQSTLTGALAGNPQGTYTYDSQHVHAADAIGSGGYTAQYDAAGNMTCRAPTGTQVCTTSSQTGAQLTYDVEGRLIQWVSADGLTTVKYGYDGEGQRFEMQVSSGGTTTTTTYIGALEEVQAVSGGATTKIVYFYLDGQRIAEDDNTHWYYPITDQLSSTTVMVDFSGVTAAQVFGPYGQGRWGGGTMPTSFAFTGQRADSTTGLDYYGARYYDPQAGQFTSADTILPGGGADPWGLSRYAYVAGNPINNVDPSGHDGCSSSNLLSVDCFNDVGHAITGAACGGDTNGYVGQCVTQRAQQAYNQCNSDPVNCVKKTADTVLGVTRSINDVKTLLSGKSSLVDRILAGADLVLTVLTDLSLAVGIGEFVDAIRLGDLALGSAGEDGARVFDEGAIMGDGGCTGLSFSADTQVATPNGEQTISSLKVGDQVQAYDPPTGQGSTQTVQHVWINHDTDLLNVTLQVNEASTTQATQAQATSTPSQGQRSPNEAHGKPDDQTSNTSSGGNTPPVVQASTSHEETIHTTANHPWLTADRGWVLAGNLRVGEPVVRGDGTTAVVALVQVVPGAGTMYDLEISHIHTFEVGVGRWVVHNCIWSSQKYDRSYFGDTPSDKVIDTVTTREPTCHWCGVNASKTADHEPSLRIRWYRGDFDGMSPAQLKVAGNDPTYMVGSCISCNTSKGARSVLPIDDPAYNKANNWDPRSSKVNRGRGGPSGLPWDTNW